MNDFLLNTRTLEVQFQDSPLVEIRPMLRKQEESSSEPQGFWARQWRKVCPRF